MIGRVRQSVQDMAAYRPGKAASQAEAEHGITDAIKLASNENPWPPLPAIEQAIADAIADSNRYADHRATAVRARIADWLDIDPGTVTVGCGSVGLLQQLMLTFVDPGDEVAFPWPSFEVYPVYTQMLSGTKVTTDLVDHAFDLDALAAAVTDRTKIVFIATPNNPTGTAVSTDAIATFLGLVPADVIVVVDEAYREFNDPSMGDPVVDLIPGHRNVVVTRTFSKAYGLAGIRTGYAVADPEVIEQVDKVLIPFAVNGLAQAATVAAIEHHGEAMDRVRKLLDERDRCLAEVRELGWDAPDAHANFVFVPTGERTDEIYLAMEKRGVVTRPFPGFGLRITISTMDENSRWLSALAAASSS